MSLDKDDWDTIIKLVLADPEKLASIRAKNAETAKQFEVLRSVWRVTEWRDGAVYKTEHVEDRWMPMDYDTTIPPDNNSDLIWTVLPLSYEGEIFRKKGM